MSRELILSSGAVNVCLAMLLWSSDTLECMLGNCWLVGPWTESCPGTLYGLEHHQDCNGHHTSLCPAP